MLRSVNMFVIKLMWWWWLSTVSLVPWFSEWCCVSGHSARNSVHDVSSFVHHLSRHRLRHLRRLRIQRWWGRGQLHWHWAYQTLPRRVPTRTHVSQEPACSYGSQLEVGQNQPQGASID